MENVHDRYGSLHLWVNVQVKYVMPRQCLPYLRASVMRFPHEEVLYRVFFYNLKLLDFMVVF